MATVRTHVDTPPERVYGVLCDPRSYEYWVVGSREVRKADPGWPAEGSKFDHTAGVLPLKTMDHTVVEEVDPEHLLRLRARARPFGTAMVTLTLVGDGTGTEVTLHELPADALSKLVYNPLLDRVVHFRNEISIRRLKELAEGTHPVPDHPLPPREEDDGGAMAARVAKGFGKGVLAGLVGGVAMTASTYAEMWATGRKASAVPARALEKVFGFSAPDERTELAVTTAAHFVVSGLAGGVWGAIAQDGRGARRSSFALFGIASLPDVAAVPALGLAPAPWRWSAADVGRTVLHHSVYAIAAAATFARLDA